VALIAKGKFREALELIREVNPLPAVCGFICHHPCEEACLRTEVDQAIPIRLLKRFVAEYERIGEKSLRSRKKKRRENILVLGSGPAGLTAANDLRLLGFGVTLFEALPVLGGMLSVGIPEFRLPRDILQMEIDGIRSLGVEMKTGHRFDFDGNNKKLQKLGFQAAFLSIGAHRSLRLNIPGERLEGVLPGVEFLRNINLGKKIKIGGKVAVIGGGNVAVDVARSAFRLGAKQVQILCIESREEMPAIPGEVEEAIHEGIKIHPLVAPIRILGKGGKAIGLEVMKLSSSRMNEKGKIELFPLKGSAFKLEAEVVMTAIGQRVDRKLLNGLDINRDGTVRVDPETVETSMKGVFAGGDVVTGPGWAIDAMAAGKKGAKSIHQYLS
jgi:NADPH-dependent glutamate synthase beta subunit-like oxidoreductase